MTIINFTAYANERRKQPSHASKRALIKKATRSTQFVDEQTFDAILAKLERYKEDQHGNSKKQERILSSVPTQAQI